MDIDCCGGGTYTLSPGAQFDFVNNTSQAVQITNCNPPLAALNYSVPAAQGGNPGRCAAQVADGATDGDYNLTVTGCVPAPPGNPIIKVMG